LDRPAHRQARSALLVEEPLSLSRDCSDRSMKFQFCISEHVVVVAVSEGITRKAPHKTGLPGPPPVG
jgi:hypothetical protein